MRARARMRSACKPARVPQVQHARRLRAFAYALVFVPVLVLALSLAVPGAARAEDDGEAAATPSASSAAASASAQTTSNKPETSPSPGSASAVNDSPENTVNTAQLPDNSFLYDTSIAALIEADSFYDGQTVQLTGEVVGDCIVEPLDRGHCWITLASTEAGVSDSLAIYLSADACSVIDGYGRYGVTGTIVQVRGTFNVACTEHEGAMDVHAESLSMVEPSSTHPDALSAADFVSGIVLIALGAVCLLAFRIARERRR